MHDMKSFFVSLSCQAFSVNFQELLRNCLNVFRVDRSRPSLPPPKNLEV